VDDNFSKKIREFRFVVGNEEEELEKRREVEE